MGNAQYLFGRVLGSGGFATVYQATRHGSTAQYAVKVLGDTWSRNDEAVSRFLAEARTLQSLQGPGILRVHDTGRTTTGQPYMALDFADLGSLAQYLAETPGPFSGATAGRVLMQTALAVGRAHESSVVHRDLKPENILLRSQEGNPSTHPTDHEILVADFGVARALLEATRQTTIMAGTPQYMAPEQYEGRADLRCDVYALGVLAYRLLTGHLPFPHSPEQMYAAKKRELYIPVHDLEGGYAGAPADVIHASLSADPNRRPSDAIAWLRALAHAVGAPDTPESPNGANATGGGASSSGVAPGGNVNWGLYARMLGVDRLRDTFAMMQRGLLDEAEFRQAKAAILKELGFDDGVVLATGPSPYLQQQTVQLLDSYRELVTAGVLAPAEFERVRRSALRQSGIIA